MSDPKYDHSDSVAANFLVRKGVVTSAEYEKAVNLKKKNGQSFFKAFKELGLPWLHDLKNMIASGKLPLDVKVIGEIENNAIRALPKNIAKNHKVVPIKLEGNTLTLTTSNPENVFTTPDLEVLTNFIVEFALAPESEIEKALAKYYP